MKAIRIIGAYVIFLFHVAAKIGCLRKRVFETIQQMKKSGYDSLILISVTAGFTGLVTAVQASYQTKGYIPDRLIGVLVGKSTMIELAPALTALVLAGKAGASIAAEIGTMKVTDQIDALESMAIDPYDFLYFPRILAGIIVVPILTIYANLISIISAFILSKYMYNITAYNFFVNMKQYFDTWDLWGGLVKSVFFGFVITSIGCFIGSNTVNGAEGVGKSTTQTVVYASILILFVDFVVASFLFGGFTQ